MRSAKVGVARQLETKKPQTGRKISTSSRGTIHSQQSQPEDIQMKYTRKELKEYRQLFNMFDTDGSGAIGNEELKQAMISIGLHANKAEIDNVIKEVDADGNGEIDFEEFCACMKKSQNIVKSTNEELIRECFEIFDQDRNGIITENEFKYIAKEFGDFDDELAEKVFRELDVSANGHLSADQFATIVEDYLLNDPKHDIDTGDSDVERYDDRHDDRASPMPNHLSTVPE
ncbi:putative calcium-binding protein B0563.7 [Caenorhabditis elegans]|uniref:Uncharacterized calcium-binding protein B0563.7 n=1 Tax=Caenorhabditis elegans TaxID=6239 RepID=YT67_CAEEL|nr:putative calcium-binding protein B0563.7 [Caenorhabditis elegans]Q11083.1 RecName: Full=Uncharacterized calcium-binding protein B0563.7 [Caenorhabditis elegans]CCD62255.1 Uncharacterized calcium-binding protein B0563.7 [Caenorhabditis elegans]|eukprot:NP_509544.1 Uncharacterized calcium-binding protein B0563.7 [Caenorhabditis elegans]